MIIPTMPTFAAGEVLTAAKLSQISQALAFQQNPPECRLARIQTQQTGLGNGSVSKIQFDTTKQDNDTMSNIAVANTKIVIVTPGVYDIKAWVKLRSSAAAGTGWWQCTVRKNNTDEVASYIGVQTGSGVGADTTISSDERCIAGDYFEVEILSGGGAMVTVPVVGAGVNFGMRWKCV